MKIIVTGSDGFVGKYLVLLLKKGKDKVYPLDLKQADITKLSEVKKYLEKIKPDQVYHLAGFASGAGKDKDLIFKVNVEGTLNIIKALREIDKPCRVLLASTAYVYGNTAPRCAKENSSTAPGSFYDQSKLKMEQEALKYSSSEPAGESRSPEDNSSRQARTINNIEILISRATNHTGPGQKLGFAVPDFCSKIAAAKNGDTISTGNLDVKRDLFDVRDCVRAYKIIMQKGKSGETYNIGTGRSVTMNLVLKKIIAISKKKIVTIADPGRVRPSDIAKSCVSCSKIKKLGWQPKISLEKTLRDTYYSFDGRK